MINLVGCQRHVFKWQFLGQEFRLKLPPDKNITQLSSVQIFRTRELSRTFNATIKHSQQTVGKESMNASNRKKTDFFLKNLNF